MHTLFTMRDKHISAEMVFCCLVALLLTFSAYQGGKDRYFYVFVIISLEAKTLYFLVFHNVMIVATYCKLGFCYY